MVILNLGCGNKVSNNDNVVNIDFSIKLLIRKNPVLYNAGRFIIDKNRFDKIESLPSNIMFRDLRKGIPFSDDSVDAVYHSHLLEHLDRNIVVKFLEENKRVLKKNGIIRIVVPDLENLILLYIDHLKVCEHDKKNIHSHDEYITGFLEQCVRKEAYGTSKQPPMRRYVENRILGDARKRAETHQWMYDRFNLKQILEDVGFNGVRVVDYKTSSIPSWDVYGLDRNSDNSEYKPRSLYMEAAE